jgi:pimeloyl-ACP methyl ester carboxylesterase
MRDEIRPDRHRVRHATLRGVRIGYVDEGRGPALLLIQATLAAELASPAKRRRYIASFYGSRFWAHPGAFDGDAVDVMTEPFADGAKLRASFSGYESSFHDRARSEPALRGILERETLILYGPSDHVIYPEFDRMAAVVFPNHVGPFLVRDCGHFLQWEAAHALNSAVRAFCRDLRA